MNWLDAFCFVSVARTQSFSITARELMITQQAVSRHIRKMEEEVGFPLFLRNYQNSVLTKAGEMILEYIARRDELRQEFMRSLHQQNTPEVLRIGWCQWIGCPTWFTAAVAGFRAANPGVTVLTYDLSADEVVEAISNNVLDVLLTSRYSYSYLPVAWSMTPITELPIYLIGAKNTQYDEKLLAYYPHIAAFAGETDEAGIRARVIRECAGMGIVPQRLEVYPEMGSVCLNVLIKGGLAMGIMIDPMREVEDFVMFPTNRTATAVLCRPYQQGNPLAERFEQFLLAEQEVLL